MSAALDLDMTTIPVQYLLTSLGEIIEVFEFEPGRWKSIYTPSRVWTRTSGTTWSGGDLCATELA